MKSDPEKVIIETSLLPHVDVIFLPVLAVSPIIKVTLTSQRPIDVTFSGDDLSTSANSR
jgi:hypothetical protein